MRNVVALRSNPLPVGGWKKLFIERADAAERFDGLSRPEAAVRAYKRCVEEWLFRNREASLPNSPCPVCRDANKPGSPLVLETGGTVWLHRECSTIWIGTRTVQAIAELAEEKVFAPTGALKELVPGLVQLVDDQVRLD